MPMKQTWGPSPRRCRKPKGLRGCPLCTLFTPAGAGPFLGRACPVVSTTDRFLFPMGDRPKSVWEIVVSRMTDEQLAESLRVVVEETRRRLEGRDPE